MGIKNRLEGKLNRAQKEGRTEDAQHLEELLNELKRTRGDAAYARTLGGGYQVRAGDTAFSVAESELGDEALVAALLLANPGVDKLKKGMYINLPDSETLAAYEALQQAEGRAGAAVGGASFEKLFPEIPPAPQEPETAGEDAMVDETVAGLLQLQQSDPALFSQLARLMDLPLASANSADTARQAAFEAREAELEAKLNPPSQPGLNWEERQRLAAQKARSQAAATGTPGPTETATPTPTFEAIPAPEPELTGTPDVPAGIEPPQFGPERDYVFQPAENTPSGFYVGYTAEDFASMSVEERMNWIWVFSEHLAPDPGVGGWFNNFWATLALFRDSQVFQGFDDPENQASQWISVSDALVFESVQNGWLLYNNKDLPSSNVLSGGEAIELTSSDGTAYSTSFSEERLRVARLWEEFFKALDENADDDVALWQLWGAAELDTVSLASVYANRQVGKLQGEQAQAVDYFVRLGDIYRTALRENVGEDFVRYISPEASAMILDEFYYDSDAGLFEFAQDIEQSLVRTIVESMVLTMFFPVAPPQVAEMSEFFFSPTSIYPTGSMRGGIPYTMQPEAIFNDRYGPTYQIGIYMEAFFLDPEHKDFAEDMLELMEYWLDYVIEEKRKNVT